MIKFFRHIRKKLLDGGKISKYLAYAVGEIILVVIGILIALQLNNLNEERKNRRLEADYYCELLEDLKHDVREIQNQIDINELRVKGSNQFISLIQNPPFTQKQVMDAMISAVSKTTFTFTPSMAVFEDLKSSGNLGLLKDLNIKNKLIAYYTFLNGLMDVIDINSEKTLESFFNYERDFSEIGWQYLEFVNTEIDTSIVDIKALTPTDYPSKELKAKLLSEAIMYLGTSSRKKDIYITMQKEILKMQDVLKEKCNSK